MGVNDEAFGNAEGVNAPIVSTIHSMQHLARRAVKEYAPIVDSLVQSGAADSHEVERTLDGLLAFCFDAEALQLFKRLCRAYFLIAPEAAAFHVYAYRDMWDSDEEPRHGT
jgi:hypothetical protein